MSSPYGPPELVGYPQQSTPAPERTGRTVLISLLSVFLGAFLLVVGYLVVINVGVIDKYTALPTLPGPLVTPAEIAAVLPGAGMLTCHDSSPLVRTQARTCQAQGPDNASFTIDLRLASGTFVPASTRAEANFAQLLTGTYPIGDLGGTADEAVAASQPPVNSAVIFRKGNLIVTVGTSYLVGATGPPVALAKTIAERLG